MTKLLVEHEDYELTSFKNEAEIEKVVVENHTKIFGKNTYYFDLKKGIRHKKGDLLTIPDGYLLTLGNHPTMTVIENELSTHDEIRHITVQLAKFHSAITETSKYNVKKFLLEYLRENPLEEKKIEHLISATHYKHVSGVLDAAIMDQKIGYAIIIDEKSEELERMMELFNPKIYVIKKFQSENKFIYHIDGEDDQVISNQIHASEKISMRKLSEIDTIVCSAREEGFNEVFLKENRWFQIPISKEKISQIKYIAMYEKKPISAIRYIGTVKEIKPYKNSGKYEVVLEGSPTKIKPIKLSKDNPNLAPQSPKYSVRRLIDNANYLEDIFNV